MSVCNGAKLLACPSRQSVSSRPCMGFLLKFVLSTYFDFGKNRKKRNTICSLPEFMACRNHWFIHLDSVLYEAEKNMFILDRVPTVVAAAEKKKEHQHGRLHTSSIDDISIIIDFKSDSKMLKNLTACVKILGVFSGKHLGLITANFAP
jgi:hypothetical protein